MYARVTTIKVDPARLGELPTKIKELTPAAKDLPGVIDIYAAWRGDGQGTVVAVYNSKADADAAAPRYRRSGAPWPAFSRERPPPTPTTPLSTSSARALSSCWESQVSVSGLPPLVAARTGPLAPAGVPAGCQRR